MLIISRLNGLPFQIGGSKLESGEVAKKLLETLVIVRHTTIARWNEHKDVKEDKERQPVKHIEQHLINLMQLDFIVLFNSLLLNDENIVLYFCSSFLNQWTNEKRLMNKNRSTFKPLQRVFQLMLETNKMLRQQL